MNKTSVRSVSRGGSTVNRTYLGRRPREQRNASVLQLPRDEAHCEGGPRHQANTCAQAIQITTNRALTSPSNGCHVYKSDALRITTEITSKHHFKASITKLHPLVRLLWKLWPTGTPTLWQLWYYLLSTL